MLGIKYTSKLSVYIKKYYELQNKITIYINLKINIYRATVF